MAQGFARGRNAPVAQSEIQAEVMEKIKPKIERSFESSRLEDELLALAYGTVVPTSRTLGLHDISKRLDTMATAIPAGRDTHDLRASG